MTTLRRTGIALASIVLSVPHSQFLDALLFMTQFVPPKTSTNERRTR